MHGVVPDDVPSGIWAGKQARSADDSPPDLRVQKNSHHPVRERLVLMANDRLSKQSKLQLILLLALGGACGVVAAVAPVRAVQLISVGAASCLGAYAGFMIYRGCKGRAKRF